MRRATAANSQLHNNFASRDHRAVAEMLSLFTPSTAAAPASDLITNLPGFGNSTWPFKAYSGYLTVPGPFTLTDYDSLEIH